MHIAKATQSYEAWLGGQIALVPDALDKKHALMAKGPFPFLRGTYYRWAQVWPGVCPDLQDAQVVLSVGDLHLENFGTWRDAEGRLIWGVNDFDEAAPLPYPNDLVRLAASALLAGETGRMPLDSDAIAACLLTGYRAGLEQGGRPFVLAERHPWLCEVAGEAMKDPAAFWTKLDSLPETPIPENAQEALAGMLPQAGLSVRFARRTAGVGSLGHPRFTAVTDWAGGRIAREAKTVVPSAVVWAQALATDTPIRYAKILSRARRACDPFAALHGGWVVRRLAPDCVKIEITALKASDASRLLEAMGWETANIHLGTPSAVPAVLRDLGRRPKGWLRAAADAMADGMRADWKDWKRDVS